MEFARGFLLSWTRLWLGSRTEGVCMSRIVLTGTWQLTRLTSPAVRSRRGLQSFGRL